VTWFLVRQVKYPAWRRPGLGQVIVGSAQVLWGPYTRDPLADFGLKHDSIAVPVTDGGRTFTLRGWHVPPPAPGAAAVPAANPGVRAMASDVVVLAVHGGGRDRRAFLRHTPCLHRAGYGVVLFDTRDHGLSDGPGRGLGLGASESRDVHAMATALRRDFGYAFVVVLGTSQGAAAAIVAAAVDEAAINAVIAENPLASRAGLLSHIVDLALGQVPPLLHWFRHLYATFALWCLRLALDAPPSPFSADPIDVIKSISPRPIMLVWIRFLSSSCEVFSH
jgi:pimeloyl-ACP methyl ester carboxylesterase